MYDLTGFLAVLSNTFNPCIKWSLKKKKENTGNFSTESISKTLLEVIIILI